MFDKSKSEKESSNIISILKGSFAALIITLVSLFIVAAIFSFTELSESLIPNIIIIITSVSILIGSVISSLKIGKMGIVNGIFVGLIYIITIYLLSSITVCGFGFNIKSIVMIISSIVLGMIGGIIGVNLSKK